jgi:vaccinia related kinase
MSRQNMKPATGSKTRPQKKVTSDVNRVPDYLFEGDMLIDIAENRWRLGRPMGVRGFGEVYLASNKTDRPVGSDAQHVVIIEPHQNGHLFMEINRYLRMAKSDMINQWKKCRKMKHIGLLPPIGSGSHVCRGEKYRFLVQERCGQDLGKLFLQSGRKFPVKTAFYIGIQILDTLEYIHSLGYTYVDIKGPSLVLGYRKGTENFVYLMDFDKLCRYLDDDGVHKKYGCDEIKAHSGTIEYCSRDAHVGAFSRRGDLESLGYNMLQWLCGKLPWEDSDDPECIYFQKKGFMSCIPLLMLRSFLDSEPPAVLSQYFEHVASLGFETTPNYDYCRELLRQGIEGCGCVDDRKLVFGDSRLAGGVQNNDERNKLRATDDHENIAELNAEKKRICISPRETRASITTTRNSPTSSVLPSHQQFGRGKIMPANSEKQVKKREAVACELPEKQVKKRAGVARKLPTNIPDNSVRVSEPTNPWHQTADKSLNNPTPAMLEIMSKMRQKQSTSAARRGGKFGR